MSLDRLQMTFSRNIVTRQFEPFPILCAFLFERTKEGNHIDFHNLKLKRTHFWYANQLQVSLCPFGIHFLCSFDPRLTARRSLLRAKGLSHFHFGLFGKWSHTEEDQPLLFPLFSKPTWVLLSQKHGTCLFVFFTHLFSAVTRLAATALVPFIFVRYRRVVYFPRQMESACVCVCLCARWRFSLPQWHGASFAAILNALAAFASDDIGQSIFHYKLWQFYYVHYELLAALCSWVFFLFCVVSLLLQYTSVLWKGYSEWLKMNMASMRWEVKNMTQE